MSADPLSAGGGAVAGYWQLLAIVAPVFVVVGLGVLARRLNWVDERGEDALLRIVVWMTYPCLVFESVAANQVLREPGNIGWPPVIGFATTALGVGVAWFAGRAIGLKPGGGLRTFALATGVYNYGYLPLPIMEGLFGRESQAVLLVHNVGVEVAIWTVGVLVLSGLRGRDGWRKMINPPVISVAIGVLANAIGLSQHLPGFVRQVIHTLATCAIPLGLLMTGSSIQPHLEDPVRLFEPRVAIGACVVRLGLLPLAFLALAVFLPVSLELKRVILVQGAMPAAVFPIILARLYGGQPSLAVQVVLATTAAGLVTIPFWLRVGLQAIGP